MNSVSQSYEFVSLVLGTFTLLFTGVLTWAAIYAGALAYKNIVVLKEQRRVDTFLELIGQMSSQRERDNRAVVNSLWDDNHLIEFSSEEKPAQRIARIIKHARYLEKQIKLNGVEQQIIRQKVAVEETISCLDTMGFFLLGNPPKLKVDPQLKSEAPEWIWSITLDMWHQLGEFVAGVQQGSVQRRTGNGSDIPDPNYGRYFKNLASEASKHLGVSESA